MLEPGMSVSLRSYLQASETRSGRFGVGICQIPIMQRLSGHAVGYLQQDFVLSSGPDQKLPLTPVPTVLPWPEFLTCKMGPEISAGLAEQSRLAGLGSDDLILVDNYGDTYTPGIGIHFHTNNPALGTNEHFRAFGHFSWERE
jgi:hypothetical protein